MSYGSGRGQKALAYRSDLGGSLWSGNAVHFKIFLGQRAQRLFRFLYGFAIFWSFLKDRESP